MKTTGGKGSGRRPTEGKSEEGGRRVGVNRAKKRPGQKPDLSAESGTTLTGSGKPAGSYQETKRKGKKEPKDDRVTGDLYSTKKY